MSEDQPTVQLPAPGNDLIPGMVTVVDEAAPTTPPPIAAQPVSLAATPAQPSGFDLVLRGYERHQVDRYVYHLTVLLEELRSRLGDSSQREAVATAELADVRAELERGRPSFEALGERVSKMLTLAESEAAQLRADAERDAKALRHASEREAAEIRTAAHRDAEELGAAARREVSDLTERRVVLLSDIAGMRDALNDVLAGATEQWPSLAPKEAPDSGDNIEANIEANTVDVTKVGANVDQGADMTETRPIDLTAPNSAPAGRAPRR